MSPRVLLFHNVVAPYRHALFAELAQRLDLRVLYATKTTRDRAWNADIPTTYESRVLNGSTLYAFGRPFTLCTALPGELRRFRPDVVLSVLTRSNALDIAFLALWCRRKRVPLVLWVGDIPREPGTDEVPGFVARPIDWLHGLALRSASAFVCYSDLSRHWIEQRGVPVARCAIGTQAFHPPPLEARVDVDGRSNRFHLLFVGKHERRKGLHVLGEALRRLPPSLQKELSITTAGDGPLAAAFPETCPPDVELNMLGFQSPDRLARLYRLADATIMPSEHDPWGNVANESMALGTPVIASRQCGCRELVERTGWIVDARSADSVADGIRSAMEEARNSQRRLATVQAEAHYRPANAAERISTLVHSL